MHTVAKFNRKILNFGKNVSSISILIMMLLIVIDVLLRNFGGTPIPGVYLIVESYLMPLAVFPALGYAYMVGILPRLNEFIEKRPVWFQKTNDILIHALDVIVFMLLVYFSFLHAMTAFNDKITISIATNLIPVWPIYFIVPIGYFFVLSELILKALRGKKFHQS